MNQFPIIVFKKVDEEPQFVRITNDDEHIKRVVGGDYDSIPYDDYFIVFRKNQSGLKPNIYVDIYSEIPKTLFGTIFAINKDSEGNFESLKKEQIEKIRKFFHDKKFDNRHFDDSGRYLSNKQLKIRKRIQQNVAKSITNENINSNDDNLVPNTLNSNENEFLDNKIMNENNFSSIQTNTLINNSNNNDSDNESDNVPKTFNSEEVLGLLLKVQGTILQFLKENLK